MIVNCHWYAKKKKKERKISIKNLKMHTSVELLKSMFHKIDAHMAIVEVLLMLKSI